MQSIRREGWKIIILSGLVGALEFYGCVVFSMFSMLISETFFPGLNALLSTIAVFFAFNVGDLSRPLGVFCLAILAINRDRKIIDMRAEHDSSSYTSYGQIARC